MNTNSFLKAANEEDDERAFHDFKLTTSTSQKDAVFACLTLISMADKNVNPNEKLYIQQMEAFLYEDTDEPVDESKTMEDMFEEIKRLTNYQKRFFIQLMLGLVSTNPPIQQHKAERIGFIVERIGVTENEFQSVLLERANKNAIG